MRRETWIAGLASAVIGAAIGLGGFTFVYAEGASYLTNDPSACANCHVMQEQLEGWRRSSHHAVAVCNDCHAPRGLFGKYSTKLINGWNHSTAFTFGGFPEPIRIGDRNRQIAEQACRHCHAELTHALDAIAGEPVACVRCHARVGHL